MVTLLSSALAACQGSALKAEKKVYVFFRMKVAPSPLRRPAGVLQTPTLCIAKSLDDVNETMRACEMLPEAEAVPWLIRIT